MPIKVEYEQRLDSLAILDTLYKYENFKRYETDFMEIGFELRSFLYQGILNGHNFGIKTNCDNGTIVVYMKRNNKWIAIDHIDENIGWNFKTFSTKDINRDNFEDISLIDFDGFRRVVFIYNKRERKFEHNKKFDRIEE